MIYKKLYFNVVIRVILLSVTFLVLAFVAYKWKDPVIIINLIAIGIIQIVLFIRNMNQVNHKLIQFFTSLEYDESGLLSLKGFEDRSFRDLYQSMKRIILKIQKMNIQNVTQKQYFQMVTEHVGVGLLSFNNLGKVKLMNRAFKEIFGIKAMSSIHYLNKLHEGLTDIVKKINPSEQKMVKIKTHKITGIIPLHLSIRAREIKFDQEKLKLISFQNISAELEDQEIESWQKLIRVLTHEIMNSTGPMTSATQTLKELLIDQESQSPIKPERIDSEIIDDIIEGLKIIEERSIGLEEFVKQFRKLTLIPQPRKELITIEKLFHNIALLFDKPLHDANIQFSSTIEGTDIKLYADKNLMEQLLINLITNSIEAIKSGKNKKIQLKAFIRENEQLTIEVIDNGPGIPADDLDKIFIPFFTRKENGTGIGLSLARQIMRMHDGTIRMESEEGKGTTFILEFNTPIK